jgi:hypothetical protein
LPVGAIEVQANVFVVDSQSSFIARQLEMIACAARDKPTARAAVRRWFETQRGCRQDAGCIWFGGREKSASRQGQHGKKKF